MYEKISDMTFEELTGAYVILKDLAKIAINTNKIDDIRTRIGFLKEMVVVSHQEKLEDMRREFYQRGENNV